MPREHTTNDLTYRRNRQALLANNPPCHWCGQQGTTANPMQDFLDMLSKAKIKDDDDYKSIKIPQFSDGTEWDAVVFELEVNLEKYWKHESDLDIGIILMVLEFIAIKSLLTKQIKSSIAH